MNTPLPEIELAIVHLQRTVELCKLYEHSQELLDRLALFRRGLVDAKSWIAEERDHGRRNRHDKPAA